MATNREWAFKMIPVLIRWAQATWDKPHYYSDLSAAVGHKTDQISNVLDEINSIITNLGKETGEEIPTLNALVRNKQTGLPSSGLDLVVSNYSKLSPESQRGEVNKLNYDAHVYDWTWVLRALKLKPAIICETDPVILHKGSYVGGEGEEHKALKEDVYNNFQKLGINKKKVVKREIEHELLSGDKLDVYIETKKCHYAIEVKPSTAPKEDVLRGIFQCIKYKAVMDAERVVFNKNYENVTILVLGGEISSDNKQIAADLGIRFEDKYPISNENN